MTVQKLIALLKEMPQRAQVGISAHDNSDWEVAGYPSSVHVLDKSKVECPDLVSEFDRERYDNLAKVTVVIHC